MAITLYPASGGSGGSEIIVTAPAGSVVTCSGGGAVKTAAENNGVWTFRGCSVGTWTVTAVREGQTASQVVQINYEDQRLRYTVALSYFAAEIVATYPVGSTCTCASGDTVLAAGDTSGSWRFAIPFAGEWILSCTDGTESASQTVGITESGQSVSVALSYALYLYNQGDRCIDITGDYRALAKADNASSGAVTPAVSWGETSATISVTNNTTGAWKGGIVYAYKKIDLTEYSTLCFVGDRASDRGTLRIVVWTSIGATVQTNRKGYADILTGSDMLTTLDVSGLTGEHVVGIHAEYGSAAGTATVVMKKFYLE